MMLGGLGHEDDPKVPLGQEHAQGGLPPLPPGEPGVQGGQISLTSSPEEVAAHLFAVVAAPILDEAPRQEIRTGNDAADFLAENKRRAEKVYEEALASFFSDPPATGIVTVDELVEGLWPESAGDILGLLYEHIEGRVGAE